MEHTNKVVVRFLVMDYNTGKKKSINHTYFTDKLFTQKIGTVSVNGEQLPYCISAISQAEDYIDTLDKTQFMIENDIYLIYDYKITYYTGMPAKNKKQKSENVVEKDEATQILEFLKAVNVDAEMMPDIAAAYHAMKSSFKGLNISIQQKALILIESTCLGMAGHNAGMARVLDVITGRHDETQKRIS